MSNICFLFFLADPFADAINSDESGIQEGLIHIRIQQRNGRKTLTTVQGISDNYDKKKIVKACKKVCYFSPLLSDHDVFIISNFSLFLI